jgi:hypothetical protein
MELTSGIKIKSLSLRITAQQLLLLFKAMPLGPKRTTIT